MSAYVTQTSGCETAEYGIPHVRFKRTETGFTVSYNKIGETAYKGFHRLGSTDIKSFGQIISLGLGLVLVSGVAVIQWVIPTRIKVEPGVITINGRRLNRRDFGHFSIHHTITCGENTVAVLGYQYGRRGFRFGGVWEAGKANEIASALNSQLKVTPSMDDAQRVSPELLRVDRPTQF